MFHVFSHLHMNKTHKQSKSFDNTLKKRNTLTFYNQNIRVYLWQYGLVPLCS